MSKTMHVAAACVYAALAAASLIGLAAAAGESPAEATEGCKAALCFVALF